MAAAQAHPLLAQTLAVAQPQHTMTNTAGASAQAIEDKGETMK